MKIRFWGVRGSIPAKPISFCGARLTYSATYLLGTSACR